jgi:hypothetical protein
MIPKSGCRFSDKIMLSIKKMLQPRWDELMEEGGKWLGPGASQQPRP